MGALGPESREAQAFRTPPPAPAGKTSRGFFVAEITAFTGLRYNLKKVGGLGKVFAPPYDVIDKDMRAALLDGSEYNIARITRSPEAEDEPEEKRYSAASGHLKAWRAEGVLDAESAPAIYAYEQEFSVGETVYQRLGLVAGLRLVDFGQGVHAHEETLSGPKVDRRLLLEQTRMHLGQIFGLYPDEAGAVNAAVRKAIAGRAPDQEAPDGEGVIHRLWAIIDKTAIAEVQGLLADKDVFIADGHHRYETALKYSREHPELPRAAHVMSTLVALSDPGLVVLPTHRLVRDVPGFDLAKLEESLEEHFRIKKFFFRKGDRPARLKALLRRLAMFREEGSNAFGLYGGGDHFLLLILEDEKAMKAAEPSRGEDWRKLDVAVLHTLILDRLLGIDKQKLAAKTNLYYLKDTGAAIDGALERIDSGEAQCVFMMSATGVAEVAAVASGGEKMPQKSTFFHPKIFTGMVIMPLED